MPLISDTYKKQMHADAQRFLDKLTPDQRAVAETIATLRVENKMLQAQVTNLKEDHGELFRVMLVILAELKETTGDPMRIHNTQFLKLEDSWRIQRSYDESTEEVVLELKTIKD